MSASPHSLQAPECRVGQARPAVGDDPRRKQGAPLFALFPPPRLHHPNKEMQAMAHNVLISLGTSWSSFCETHTIFTGREQAAP